MPASDSSSLSSVPPSEEELPPPQPKTHPKKSPKKSPKKQTPKKQTPKKQPSKVKKPKTLKLVKGKLASSRQDAEPSTTPEPTVAQLGREPSPPHDFVLADNPDIAFIVMFRSRFSEAFPKNLPNIGPQDIENGVAGPQPSELVEDLLCALLGILLNRKKFVERGHHSRALEEALSSQKHQWPSKWNHKNPLAGARTFTDMNADERLNLLRTLIIWSLQSSEYINTTIKNSYKQNRHDDDLNQPLFVPPWGHDTRKRAYYLIEGQNDTPFRIYVEADRKGGSPSWWSVASTIDEAKSLARDLRAESGQAAHRLAQKILAAVPLLEQRDDKRKRKEYRQQRKAQFSRPQSGYSIYEGRTRGKRTRYTFEDDEDNEFASEDTGPRKSRRQSGTSTPASGPTFTASGRQVRSRFGKGYGETAATPTNNVTNGAGGSSDADELANDNATPRGDGRPRRSGSGVKPKTNGAYKGYNAVDELDEESDAVSSDGGGADQWDGDDQDFEGKMDKEDDESDDTDTDTDADADADADGDVADDSLGDEEAEKAEAARKKLHKEAMKSRIIKLDVSGSGGGSAPASDVVKKDEKGDGHVLKPAVKQENVQPPPPAQTNGTLTPPMKKGSYVLKSPVMTPALPAPLSPGELSKKRSREASEEGDDAVVGGGPVKKVKMEENGGAPAAAPLVENGA